MKTRRTLPALLLLAAALSAAPAVAGQRVVLFETFTNTGCGYCPDNNAAIHDFVTAYGEELILSVQYHTAGPSISDPFYQANTVDNGGRDAYYDVTAVPSNFCDGAAAPTSDGAAIKTAVGNALAVSSPLEMDVTAEVVGTAITVDVSVTATDAVPATGLALYIAIVEPEVYTDPPGADNGERYFYCTMRDMLPTYAGQAISIAQGQTLDFTEVGTVDPAWRFPYAVAWVQDGDGKAVLQAAASLTPVSDYAFFYGAEQVVDIVPMGLHSFPSSLENRGLQGDTYGVHVDWDLPAGWGGGVCENGACHGVGDDDFTIRTDPGEIVAVSVDIEPFGGIGQGSVTVTVTSGGDPALSWAETFKVITYGVPILCVEDDGTAAYESYYHAALDATGFPYGTWDRAAFGKLDPDLLDSFHVVVWNVGWNFPALEPDDVSALTAFLDDGGNLFISGQDIGWDVWDAGGSSNFPAAQAFYRDYLGATYVLDDTNLLTVSGVAGDPIGDGLSFDIYGGTGANNQQYPSEIEPYGTGAGCLTYAAGREAGMRNDGGAWKTVYLAFGFEGVALEADRALIMDRVLDWFDTELVGVPGDGPPVLAAAPTAAPNPFNPTTRIAFSVGGSRPVPAEVALYDLRGRRVRTLWNGPLAPGPRSLTWNGRTDAGAEAASGVYLARIRLADRVETLKLTLAK